MHTTASDGTVLESRCDFCTKPWLPEGDQIMIEGHQGSLICTNCLSTAYRYLVLEKLGGELGGKLCKLCLEERDQAQWESPVEHDCRACLRCVRQAATALSNDPDTGWTKPA